LNAVLFTLALLLLTPFATVYGQTPAPSPSPMPSPAPSPEPTSDQPQNAPTEAVPPAQAETTQASRNSLFTLQQARPVPPLPSLVRLGVITEQTLPLTLDEAIRRALENNNEIEVERNNVRLSETTLNSLEGVYQPLFAVTPQYTNRVVPVTTTFQGAGASSTISTKDFTIGPSVTKLFRTGGGRYDAFFNNTRSSTTGTFQTFNPSYQSELGVQFTQPLLRDRAIDSFRRDIRVQRKRLEQSDADFRRRVIEIISNVQNAYWELVFALRDQQNRIANLNLARENFRLTEARVAAGALAPLARAEVQTELSTRETELLLASQSISQAENNLKQLLLGDPTSPLWSAQILPTDEPTIDDTPVLLENALAEARQNRPELRRLRLQQEINDIDTQFFRNQTRPRVDLQSTLSTGGFAGTPFIFTNTGNLNNTGIGGSTSTTIPLFDTSAVNTSANAFLFDQINLLRERSGLARLTGTDIPTVPTQPGATTPDNLRGGIGRSFRNLFTFDQRTIVVGVRIEFPFRNRTAAANLAGARIQRTQLDAQSRQQEQAVQTEVRNSAQTVEIARRRVQTARTARESAEIQLEGERQLFQAGRSTQFLLFQRENALAAARNLELRAQTDYNQALANLQRATSTTLQINNIIINTPTEN
jgi:HAE1 family hydrophobic/amphiphilic exporter-1